MMQMIPFFFHSASLLRVLSFIIARIGDGEVLFGRRVWGNGVRNAHHPTVGM